MRLMEFLVTGAARLRTMSARPSDRPGGKDGLDVNDLMRRGWERVRTEEEEAGRSGSSRHQLACEKLAFARRSPRPG